MSGCDALIAFAAAELRVVAAAARDVAEAADQGDGHPAAARSQTVVTAIIDGGGCGSRKQEAAAHRHASKASKGSIAGRGAASFAYKNWLPC